FHSSMLVPSNRTTAFSGGLAPRVGLLRSTRFRSKASPSSLLPVSLPPSKEPVHLPFVSDASLSFVVASHFTRVFASQPAPGRPPPRKYTSNLPSPFATT